MKFERGILIDRDSLTDVYRGRQRSSGQVVAMKGLREEFCSEASVSLFEREGGVGAQIHHPNVVRLLDVTREQGRPYLVLEALDGETLQARLHRGALREDETVDIAQQVAAGLAQAHRQGLAHCALQPSLILVCRDQTVKVMDFGLSEFTAQLARMYPEVHPEESIYLSPEQRRGETGDARSDIYALGVMMTDMLTSAAPLSSPSRSSLFGPATQKRNQDEETEEAPEEEPETTPAPASSTRLLPLPHSVSPRVRAIIQKALHVEPIARFASGGEMLAALQDPAWRDRDLVQEAMEKASQRTPLVEDRKEKPIREEAKQSPSKMLGFLVAGVLMLGALFAVTHRSGTSPNDDSDATPVVSRAKSARPMRITPKSVAATKPAATSQPIAAPQVIPETTPQEVSANRTQPSPKEAIVKSPFATRLQELRVRRAASAPSARETVIRNLESERARPIRRARRVRIQRARVQRARVQRVRVRRLEPVQRVVRRSEKPRPATRIRRIARVPRVEEVRRPARVRLTTRPRAASRPIRPQALPF